MMNELRDLKQTKIRAALEANRQLALAEIQELPLATQQNKKYMLPMVCKRSGVTVGAISLITVAGTQPLLGQWKDTQVLHPFFSMGTVALLQFARNSWVRFCALTAEETADTEVVVAQELQLRICTLAMLHNLTEFKQERPWLPDWNDVVSNWQGLMSICYWRAYLDSHRFKFPSLRISRTEPTIDLRSFLKLCFDSKKRYESNLSDLIEEEKSKIAEAAMKRIQDAVGGKHPVSTKILWRWFVSQMPARYKKDLDGWMWELFTASEKDILEFTIRDIELFEEIVVTEVETGSTVSHAFLEVVRSKHKLLSNHFQAYEIIVPDMIAEQVASGEIVVSEEPKLADFPSRVKWFIAHSKWKLAQPSAQKHQAAEKARQATESVAASFIPRFRTEDDIPEIDADDSYNPTEIRGDRDSNWGELNV
jgi:hypothetical protein